MTMWQRIFHRQREMDARDLSIQLGKLTDEQVRAVVRVAQRVIDGRCAILARSAHLSTEEVHTQRGAIAGMQDFIDFFGRVIADSRNDRQGDDE